VQGNHDSRNSTQSLGDPDFAKPVMAQNRRLQVCGDMRGVCLRLNQGNCPAEQSKIR